MGTTVIKIFSVLLFLLLFIGCVGMRESGKEQFVPAYKAMVFNSCMREITDGKIYALLSEKGDNVSFIGAAEIIGTDFSDSAAVTAKEFVSQIQPMVPDAEPGHDFYQKKPLMARCLAFYDSKRLDSIAKKMYRQAKANGWKSPTARPKTRKK